MRYAILGAGGQLGSDLVRTLGDRAVPLTHAVADVADPASFGPALDAAEVDVVVNCAAYNFVDQAEREPEAAFALNALAVQRLAQWCRSRDKILVHFGTDYVFGRDLTRKTPYAESDAPCPSSVYGVSKLAGEQLALLWHKSVVVRSCGLYGLAGRTSRKGNFVEMILRQVSQGKPLRVVDDQRCTPTFTLDLAKATLALVDTGRFGLYHLTSAGDCTWHEFAQGILTLSSVDLPIERVKTGTFGELAKRPGYSVLAGAAAASLDLAPMRSWREALAEYLSLRSRSTP